MAEFDEEVVVQKKVAEDPVGTSSGSENSDLELFPEAAKKTAEEVEEKESEMPKKTGKGGKIRVQVTKKTTAKSNGKSLPARVKLAKKKLMAICNDL